MPRSLCERTLPLSLGFLIPSSQTTDFSLIAKLSESTAVNWVSRIGIPLQLTPNGMGKWVDELSHVLWTYRIIPCRSTRETLFSMTYGAKAMIPLETRFPTLRTSLFTPDNNDNLLENSLDLVEERRENAMVQLAYY